MRFAATKLERMSRNEILTERETEILRLIADGYTDTEIGRKLSISGKTVSTHRKNMLRKLNLRNTAVLVRYAMEKKLVE